MGRPRGLVAVPVSRGAAPSCRRLPRATVRGRPGCLPGTVTAWLRRSAPLALGGWLGSAGHRRDQPVGRSARSGPVGERVSREIGTAEGT
ncbi:hypothetical protein [Actinoplanes regularis]|uniref:hypothetical protein n=1 Tax=Actinoplanes regularis TaxID=52697 RepID=UPI0011786E56|nr:hypothetical protein [Actinoplanes regularis]